MDTEKTFMFHGQFDGFSFAELSPEELAVAKHHVEITRHLQEIHHLYLMFQYSLDSINEKYVLMSNGEVLKNNELAVSEEDYIAINTMVNNLISAGRTLVESMECYVSENYLKGDSDREEYLEFYRDTYNHSFAYRFLIRMRDYAQHGHLPVNQHGTWYGFDLYQVLNKPHYKHNGTIKQQLKDAIEEVKEVYGDMPRLSLAMTLAEFTAYLLSIYDRFWLSVEKALVASEMKFKELIASHPENVNVVGAGNVSLFVYDYNKDGLAYTVCLDDNATQMLSIFKKEAEVAENKYMNSWQQLREGTLFLRVVDKQRIEIASL